MKSFAETPISSQSTIYLKDALKRVLEVEVGDVLEWFLENGQVSVKKKEVSE